MQRVVLQRRSARVGYLPGGGLACLPIMPMQAMDGVALYAMALKANLRELSEKSGRRWKHKRSGRLRFQPITKLEMCISGSGRGDGR